MGLRSIWDIMMGLRSILRSTILLAVVVLCMQLSCGKSTNPNVGPCLHVFEEPILHIVSARNAHTGTSLRSIMISDIEIDGIRQDPFSLAIESRSVAVLDSSLVCNPPCAFGIQAGMYTFRVSADGCRDTVVTCYPDYTVNKGGCPSSSSGGLRISLDLQEIGK